MKSTLFLAVFFLGWLAVFYYSSYLPDFLPEKWRFAQLVDKAKTGDSDAMLRLGQSYETGVHGEKDMVKALKWYKEALIEEHPAAYHHLGELAFHGKNGIKQDIPFAMEYLENAASLGYAPSYLLLGFAHENGKGVKKSLTEAYFNYYLARLLGEREGNRHVHRIRNQIRPSQRKELEKKAEEIQLQIANATGGTVKTKLKHIMSVTSEKNLSSIMDLEKDAGTVSK